jgi:hypothetical protein
MIEFHFDPEQHLYTSKEGSVLATSDILYLNGLCDYSQVPLHNLEHARWRGEQLHKAVQFFHEDDLDEDDIPEPVLPYFQAYEQFCEEMKFEPIPPLEHGIVYRHKETGQLVGCHIDLRGWVNGELFIIDPKTSHPNSGKAKKQTHLRWRMQLRSYSEATTWNDEFWEKVKGNSKGVLLHKAILHLKKDGIFDRKRDFLELEEPDDQILWNSMVRVAQAKIAAGFQRDRK